MEAMKTPFFPLYHRLREHLEQDPIGQVAFVRAGSSVANLPLNHPIYNLDVGGGSLLGIGPYEAFLALDWLGPVERVQTFGQIVNPLSARKPQDFYADMQDRIRLEPERQSTIRRA
jgi:scyllo-inositol 2-dehydrogenase (NADP+)